MAVSVKTLKPGIPRNLLLSILLGIMTFFVPGPAFSGPPRAPDAGNPDVADRAPAVDNSCAKIPPTCNQLCREALSEESRAKALEEEAEAARSKADMAKKRAVYFENLAEKRDLEARRSGGNRSRLLWKGAESLLRLLVPRSSRNNSRYESRSTQSNTSGNKKRNEKVAVEAWERADEARESADKAVDEAYEAAKEAVTARAAADAARSSYEECICR